MAFQGAQRPVRHNAANAALRFAQLIVSLGIIFLFASAPDAATLFVTKADDGRFTVAGSEMDGVAGIDLTLNYDADLLSDPMVSQGALIYGSLMMVNANTPGVIKIAAINSSPFSGKGELFGVSFTSVTGKGNMLSAAATLWDNSLTNPAVIPSVVYVFNVAGDCDGSGAVTIAEVQSAINMFLGLKQVQACVDTGNDNQVSISEVQKVINGFLGL